jgi:CheY-like chemotaxis protein
MSCSATTTPRPSLIYVVDDEALLLEMAERALRNEGYALKKFQDPEAAFKAFAQEPNKPALLVTDYAMSPINGFELSARCKTAHPPLKILMVSGTVDSHFVEQAPVAVDEFIPKPYEPAHLARTVRSLLNED